ncbi:MAG: hypothetical protein A3F04_01680 [Candidatus Chisholmbacteria bacterium RIFCSPHIGHO2_12_FULL_49_9]|uniref:Uncharacterized protein n=1 Tax=Candidatus Chisholmbacteria bacterium RIFCSPHIGHO2_01_FULL_52_32 TaxID=1797591 RepID=A0A1G1VS16_9BACT|nr:MAG: hypothetical protein A3F04_01680 [Candidatus Chisholmbacteria bacterium RIFCSPHIGHO2_12_FULL_49_9]OGY18193.1 MAG: hypothetical protein A2786_01600 [Candidatus Chisholmbacteria bacterium RIFCSPHIGHO2_01_FULL_52_32]OGY20433.1 MAG: hypothetical protein A2900_05140 [Candidatus Chisholmbacteria bacterium RIFCSPLOWO2_01_FULL_50_28]
MAGIRERQTQFLGSGDRNDRGAAFVIASDGFVDLSPLETALPTTLRELPDETFLAWAADRPETHEGREGRDFDDIVTFVRGRKGDWITLDMSKLGIFRSEVENLKIDEGVPYVVNITGRNPAGNKGKGVYFVDVLRQPSLEDLEIYSRALSRKYSTGTHLQLMRDFVHAEFYPTWDGKTEGYVSGRGGLFGGFSGPLSLDWRAKIHPDIYTEWVGMANLRSHPTTFIPVCVAKEWERQRVTLQRYPSFDDQAIPVVQRTKYWGIRGRDVKTVPVDSLGALDRVSRSLPIPEQAILARLWNIHWQGQGERRELISSVLDRLKSENLE